MINYVWVMNMKISEIAKKTNLSVDTVRYYQKLKIIKANKIGKDYVYDESHIILLGYLKRLKDLGTK